VGELKAPAIRKMEGAVNDQVSGNVKIETRPDIVICLERAWKCLSNGKRRSGRALRQVYLSFNLANRCTLVSSACIARISWVIANGDAACNRRGWKKRAMRWLRRRWRTIPRQEFKIKYLVEILIFAWQTLPDLKAEVKRSLQQQECDGLRCM
jgi:hypothetical protein